MKKIKKKTLEALPRSLKHTRIGYLKASTRSHALCLCYPRAALLRQHDRARRKLEASWSIYHWPHQATLKIGLGVVWPCIAYCNIPGSDFFVESEMLQSQPPVPLYMIIFKYVLFVPLAQMFMNRGFTSRWCFNVSCLCFPRTPFDMIGWRARRIKNWPMRRQQE